MERTIRRDGRCSGPKHTATRCNGRDTWRGHSPARCWLNRLTRIRLRTMPSSIALGISRRRHDGPAPRRRGHKPGAIDGDRAGTGELPDYRATGDPETRAAVKADVFGDDAYPQMLLRIGWAPVNADPLPSTPRRDLSEVVARLDGSPLG